MTRVLPLPDGRTLAFEEYGDPGGVPVVFLPGTPSTHAAASLSDDDARAAGVRLLSPSRPGYGGSSPSAPGLRSTAEDVLVLMDALEVDRAPVVGVSGGGPFALALAVVAPHRVTRVVVLAGVAPVDGALHADDPAATAALRLLADGDIEGAVAGMTAATLDEVGALLELPREDAEAALLAEGPPNETWLAEHPVDGARFAAQMRDAIEPVHGWVRDQLSWGGAWDVDPADVRVPVTLVYGLDDQMVPPEHGEILARLIPHADLHRIEGAAHGDVCFGRAGEALATCVPPAEADD